MERGDSLPEQAATEYVSAPPIGRRRLCAPRPPAWPTALGSIHARNEARESAHRNRRAHWPTSMAGDDRLGGPSAHSTPAETLWPRRGVARAPEAAKGGPGVMGHRQPPVPRRCPQRLDVHADQQREYGLGKKRVVVAMRRQRPRSCEHLRRRCPPSSIPGPIRLGGRHRAWPRTPLATGPARSGTHAACGSPRRHTMSSPPATVKRGGWRGAYFSQPIFEPDRSLCSLHIRRGGREKSAQSANCLGKWRARQDSNLRPSA